MQNREKVTLQQLTENQGTIGEQTAKIASPADKLQGEAHISILQTPDISGTKGKREQNYAQAVAHDQWLELQSRVDTLSSKQARLEKEKEREKRYFSAMFLRGKALM